MGVSMRRKRKPSTNDLLWALGRATRVLGQTFEDRDGPPGLEESWEEVYVIGRILARLLDVSLLPQVSEDPELVGVLWGLFEWVNGQQDPEADKAFTAVEDAVLQAVTGMNMDVLELLFTDYEHFLAGRSPTARRTRGVYYTPEPLVRFVVGGVDELLREHFKLDAGLGDSASWSTVCARLGHPVPAGVDGASPFVRVFDPAAGTGAFLVEAQRLGVKASTPEANPLGGSEIMLIPRILAEARLKLAGASPKVALRWGNTLALEPASLGALTVVLGNPPYSGLSANHEYHDLVRPYYAINGEPVKERKSWLTDDYVKFFRWAQERVLESSLGVVALVTPHGFLSNPSFRGMRHSLLKDFDDVYVVDLHGNANRREKTPEGHTDANVFQIRQGIAVSFWVRSGRGGRGRIRHADCWGRSTEDKLQWVGSHGLQDISWSELEPETQPFLRMSPGDRVPAEYERFLPVRDMFPVHSTGIITSKDRFLIDSDRERLLARVQALLDETVTDETLQEQFGLRNNYAWRLGRARCVLRESLAGKAPSEWLKRISYRPFCPAWIFYHPALVWRTRSKVMAHLVDGETPSLVTVRQLSQWDQPWRHVAVGRGLVESCFISNRTREINYVFPLFLKTPAGREANLSLEAVRRFAPFTVGLSAEEGATAIFDYTVAVLQDGGFRQRYRSALAVDFPRIPVPQNGTQFRAFAERGAHIRGAFLAATDLPAMGESRRVTQSELLALQQEQDIPQDLWATQVGAYSIVKLWLGRGGRSADLGALLDRLRALQSARTPSGISFPLSGEEVALIDESND
jgi:hypothetical protein